MLPETLGAWTQNSASYKFKDLALAQSQWHLRPGTWGTCVTKSPFPLAYLSLRVLCIKWEEFCVNWTRNPSRNALFSSGHLELAALPAERTLPILISTWAVAVFPFIACSSRKATPPSFFFFFPANEVFKLTLKHQEEISLELAEGSGLISSCLKELQRWKLQCKWNIWLLLIKM